MNTKKILVTLLALSMAAGAAGCKYEIELETEATDSIVIPSDISEETSEETSEESESSEAAGTSFEEGPVTDQILSFAEHTDVWYRPSDVDEYYYCVTDLDADGGLELIAATSSGSGDFTTANVYVADNVEVRECSTNLGDGDFFPNIIVDSGTSVTVFQEGGVLNYVFYYNNNSGDLESSTVTSLLAYSDEHIDITDLCQRKDSEGVVTFTDLLTGEAIDESTYNGYLANYLSGLTTSVAHFQWVRIDDPTDCASALMLSYNGFSN